MKLEKWRGWSIGIGGILGLAIVVALLALLNFGSHTQLAQAGTSVAASTATNAAATVTNSVLPEAAGPAPTIPATRTTNTDSRLISVYAVGKVQAAPDVAYLNVGVELQAPTAREAQDKVNARVENIRKAITEAGIPAQNIQPQGIYTYPVETPGKNGQPPTEPTSYRAGISLNVTITDLAKAGTALDAATKAGANQIGGLNFALKDDSALRTQALEEAVKQARPKAEAIARGLGQQIGQVVTVIEDPNGYYPDPSNGGGGKGGSNYTPAQLTVGVRVTVSYAIQ